MCICLCVLCTHIYVNIYLHIYVYVYVCKYVFVLLIFCPKLCVYNPSMLLCVHITLLLITAWLCMVCTARCVSRAFCVALHEGGHPGCLQTPPHHHHHHIFLLVLPKAGPKGISLFQVFLSY